MFMILKAFKDLLNAEEYVYRTINNDIIDPEFNKLVQLALKSKSVISLNDERFDKTILPLVLFLEGVTNSIIEGRLKSLLVMCHGKPSGKHRPLSREVYISGYDLIQNWILDPIKALFETKLSFVYSPGIPIIFHWNYTAVKRFMRSLKMLNFVDSSKALTRLFNLSTYFTLVSRDTIKSYTTSIDNIFTKGKIESGEESLSALVISTINKLIGPDVFLVEIADKLVQLWFQIIVKVIKVTKDSINKKSMSAENLLRTLDEVTKIKQYLSHDFLDNLSTRIAEECTDNLEIIQGALSDAYHDLYYSFIHRFEEISQPWITAASEKIILKIAENMQKFKKIAGLYRVTNKKAPTTPSECTKTTYQPVSNLTTKPLFTDLSTELKSLLLNSIFQKSLVALMPIVKSMLEEEKQKSNSLAKFSKDKLENTDFDNICIQM